MSEPPVALSRGDRRPNSQRDKQKRPHHFALQGGGAAVNRKEVLMTNVITFNTEGKALPTRAGLLDDRMTELAGAFGVLAGAAGGLVTAIEALDDDDAPEGVRNIASRMHAEAEQIRSQCRDLFGVFCLLEHMADKASG
jgi:hypothetical protein